jgi:predicted transcriptional regulator
MNYTELKKQLLSDPEVKAEYDALEPEYQFIRDMLACREELSLSQQGLADLTGIDRSDISRIENGNANPSLKTMKRIASGLGKRLEIRIV